MRNLGKHIVDTRLNHLIFNTNSTTVRSRTISDYSPFGVLLKERTVESAFFRTGFQGQERDDEVGGNGNHYTAEYWEFNPRIGKRWDRDPVVKYHESPYACFANNPIWFKDPDGADTTLDISSRALINDLIDPNSSNYNSAYAADFQKLVNDKTTLYSFVQWPGAKKEARDDGTTGVTYGQLSASGKNSSGQNLVNVEYSLETTTQGHKLDALFEESDHAVQFLNQRIGFYENPNVPGDFIVMGYDFMDEVDNKISVVKYLSNFTDQSSYKTQLYGMNAKILKSNFSADAAKRAVRLNYTFDNENVVDVFQAASTITGGALSDQQIRADFKNGVRWPNILIGGN